MIKAMIFLSCCQLNINKTSMQAQLKMRVEYQQPSSLSLESPFINVLPSEPLEAYKRLDPHTLDSIKKTERIPFPALRELILMYVLQNQEVIDVTPSELLKERLSAALEQDHAAISSHFDSLLKERGRLAKLNEATLMYIQKRDRLVSNELRRTINKRFDGNELASLMGLLQQKKDNEFRLLQRKVEEAARTNARVDVEREKGQIQAGHNRDILKLFEQQTPKLARQSEEFHEVLETINWFKLFMDDFEKALVFIISARQIVSKSNRRADERLLKDVFQVELQRQVEKLGDFLDHELEELFEWRSKAKYGRADPQLQRVEKECMAWRKKLQESVYELLPDLITIVRADRDSMRSIEGEVSKQYCLFLPGYYDAKEVELFYKRESKIQEILENERQLLTAHLKRNYSMMVYYSHSAEYMNCIEDCRTRSKGYLRDILTRKIAFLDLAIAFVNKDYADLYREACDGRPGTQERILSKCRQLEEGLKENQTILTLLLESCRRLLNILSK